MDQNPTLRELLKKYPKNTACIQEREPNGRIKNHFIGAMAGKDNEETLRAHLAKWFPGAEFLGWAIK